MRSLWLCAPLLVSLTACGGTVSTPDSSPRDGSVSMPDGGLRDSAVDAAEDGAPSDSSPDTEVDSQADALACEQDGACTVGTVCAAGVCTPCGEPGMACCAQGACDPPANACLDGVCVPMR